MTIDQLRNHHQHLLLKCVSGSQAYGLALPHSDTDIKGVFVLPKAQFYGLHEVDQVNNETNDEMYYEIKKLFDLLLKNNPNLLELLSTPEDCVLYRHPLMDHLTPRMFLSRLCNQTFGRYAWAQIKKARGLNKKILNPLEAKRKTILDFCYVVAGQGAVPLTQWLSNHQYQQEGCGLIRIDHLRDTYALFHESQTGSPLQGISSGDTADDVSLSAIPKGLTPLATMHFNKDGYTRYCKEYKQYWQWVKQRNEHRYENTMSHGKHYDAKNMMHVFRLLHMAEEIARHQQIIVRRPDREYLLKIRAGEFAYEDLVSMAEEKMMVIDELFQKSDLPDAPDVAQLEPVLVRLREAFYATIIC